MRYVHARSGADCFADDTGLEVAALGGAPGVHSARYATEGHDFEANVRLLLHNLEGVSDRRARFRTVVALILDGQEYTFEGIVNGTIAESPRGGEGFGYDPVFIPDGYAETFAQMPAGLKTPSATGPSPSAALRNSCRRGGKPDIHRSEVGAADRSGKQPVRYGWRSAFPVYGKVLRAVSILRESRIRFYKV